MADRKKLERWAEKLLDTGKRNNLISFKDTKASTAEAVFPDCEKIFSKCSVGHIFDVFDPQLPDEDADGNVQTSLFSSNKDTRLSKADYIRYYSQRMSSNSLLFYSQTPNPITAVRSIAKKAQQIQEETGLNVACLAFGFLEWAEKLGAEQTYRAPLLLVHVNIKTGSILDPIKIEISDDDLVVNPTFNYLMKSDYGLELPTFEDGDTLNGYYSKVTGIVRKLGWSVIEECKLGVFSFLKINMYEDLKNNAEQILQNSNVRALIGESPAESASFSAEDYKGAVENPLIELHTVVDADSSQIEAIEMAKSGKSFVLQGPPGTGKSQTITNIIAECLHDGKKVLFVSEKQAALNVVYDKLRKAGISDFCLELHSHKANKKAVINELNRTLETLPIREPNQAQEEIRRKKESLTKLDAYASALHQNRTPVNKSLFQLFELCSSNRRFPDIGFKIKDIQKKGEEWFLSAVKYLEQYVEYIPSIGRNYRQNCWYGFLKKDIGYEEQLSLKSDLELLSDGFTSLRSKTARIKVKYETPDLNYSDTLWWQSFLKTAAESDVITPSILTKSNLEHVFPHLEKMRELSVEIIPVREEILANYTPNIISELNGEELVSQLKERFHSAFSRLFSGEYKQLISRIRQYSKSGGKISYSAALTLAESLLKMQSACNAFSDEESQTAGCLGSCYNGVDTEWETVFSALNELRKFNDHKNCSYGSIPDMSSARFSESKPEFMEDAEELDKEINAVSNAKAHIVQLFDKEVFDPDSDSYEYCVKKMDDCLRCFGKLGNWTAFSELLDRIGEVELPGFIDSAIENELAPEEITGTFRRSYYENWIDALMFSVPEIRSFTRINQDQTVREFCSKDALQYEISKLQIKAELSQKRPNLQMVAGGSAVSLLRRENQKKRKQLPIRPLLSETAELVQLLKPCFMMSPLSVSTYLDPEKIRFDTVVFDEASQIFPQDAIGAVYRGAQLIVVGDSKQMPPSNFFNSSTENEDEDDEEIGDVTDFESLLDICSSVFNTERLAWHYRSHYEQLIAFSNLNFYNNKLVTFPSACSDRKGIGVDYYRVDGVFDRRSKTNRAEAEFIVDLIYKNIEEYPKRSLGVVAFSAAQQGLIDKILSKRRESDPSHEWFFSGDRPEPFFIKNLETVQGDERDTIIFSVAYARDSQGRFINNFGPLNREGGERRLNVAVTRAKDNVQLVASISYTDIDLKGAGSEGARLLRAYLDYAQNGEKALERSVSVQTEDSFDSDFELEVCEFLRDKGFTVDTQIGCSGYKIDMGVRLTETSDYVLAVECDGATYHASKNARDRDSLRQRVLENMGWQFYRIWSTDWYRNKAVEKEALLRTAREAVRKRIMGEDSDEKGFNVTTESAETAASIIAEEIIEKTSDFPKYREVDALEVLYQHYNNIQSALKELLAVEAPLSEDYLLKRIVSMFKREKVTSAVWDRYEEAMRGCGRNGIVRRNGFLYLAEMNKIRMRVPGDRRDIQYIAIEELADGILTLVRQNVTVSRDGLYKTMTNLLGFNRTGDAIVERYEKAVDLLIQTKMIKDDNGVLSSM